MLQWHALDKSEQAKYYEMARKERAIHMQLYPGWSARDNYAQIGRKKKRPRDKNEGTYFFLLQLIYVATIQKEDFIDNRVVRGRMA